MTKMIENSLVEGISINVLENRGSLRSMIQISGPNDLTILINSLSFFNWGVLFYIASGVCDGKGVAIDGTGFRYPTDELDPGEEPLEGVEVYNPLGEVQVSVSSFEQLMLRYFRASISGAEQYNKSMLTHAWWNEFVAITETIGQRVPVPVRSARQ